MHRKNEPLDLGKNSFDNGVQAIPVDLLPHPPQNHRFDPTEFVAVEDAVYDGSNREFG